MKYLVKKTSGEETICEKVEVDNQDYYLSNDDFNYPCFVVTDIDKLVEVNKNNEEYYHRFNSKKVIATTNPSLGLPMVVDEVEELASKSADIEECFNNVDGDCSGYYDYIEGYKIGYNKAKKTYSYTKEDMVEFTEWLITKSFREGTSDYTTEELFDIWQEQRTITINVK